MPTYLHSNTKQRKYPVKSGVAITKGNFLYCDQADGFTVKPAGSFTWNSTLATTQSDFALRFVGIAAQDYTGSTFTAPNCTEYGLQDGMMLVLEDGVFEDNCASARFYPGTLVGPAKQSGNLLEPDKTVQTSTEVTSIGRVYEDSGASATTVKFSIHPNLASITTAADAGS